MPSWPSLLSPAPDEAQAISNAEVWRALGNVALMTSAVWSANNLAVYAPIYVRRPVKLSKVGIFNGAAASGNFDVGVYAPDAEGKPGARLWNAGSFGQAGVTQIQTRAIAGGLWISGLLYLAAVFDNTTAQVIRLVASASGSGFCLGSIFTQAAAFPLPANATPNAGIVAAAVPYLAGYI